MPNANPFGYDTPHRIYRSRSQPQLHMPRAGQAPVGTHRGYALREVAGCPEARSMVDPTARGILTYPSCEASEEDGATRWHKMMHERRWPQKPATRGREGVLGARSDSPEASLAHGELFPKSLQTVSARARHMVRRPLTSGETCTPRLPRGYGMTGQAYHGTLGGAFPPGHQLAGGQAVWTTLGTRRPEVAQEELRCAAERSMWSREGRESELGLPSFAMHSHFASPTTSLAERTAVRFQAYSVWPHQEPAGTHTA